MGGGSGKNFVAGASECSKHPVLDPRRAEMMAEGLGRGMRVVNIGVRMTSFPSLVETAKALVRTSAYRACVGHRCRPQQY